MKRIYLILAFLIGGTFAVQAQDTAALTLLETPSQSSTERDTLPQQNHLSAIAQQRWNQQNFDESIANFERSLAVSHQLSDTANEATINRELGELHIQQGDYEAAVGYLKKSLAMYQAASDTVRQGLTLLSLATALNHVNRHTEALNYLNNSLPTVQRGKDIQLVRLYYGLLAQTYQHLGQAEPAMEYFMYYMSIDSEIQERVSRRVQQQAVLAEEEVFLKKQELAQTMSELEKAQVLTTEQRSAISELNAETALKEMAINEKEARLKNEAWVRRLLTGGVVLSLGMLSLVVVYSRQTKKKNVLLAQRNEAIKKQKSEIENQQEELLQQSSTLEEAHRELGKNNRKMLHSINYAQRIQGAMLPEEADLQHLVNDSFIFFRPRDIVSGDFYWFTETRQRTLDNQLEFGDLDSQEDCLSKVLIAAMDCTGHGVPGALMSMIGFNFLNDIEQKGIFQPNEILNTLHLSVRRFLKQDETANKDGMDAALCLIDPQEGVLEFAGANRPLVYIQDGEMHVIKGDRSAVGGADTNRNHRFTKHRVPLDKETWVYLFSDGYQDQFGGPRKSKFMSKKLRELLLKIHTQPFAQQKEHLDQTLRQWIGPGAQIDDILVMGFKVGG
ncbi:MAG: SpoIIE family protein phosphatase [Tunicatimonas sp.]